MEIKYKKIYSSLRDKILRNDYMDNEQIPDEKTLCKEYDCSRMTVKKALDLLVQDGLIYRKRGHGSFVMAQNMKQKKTMIQEGELTGLTMAMKDRTRSEILQFELKFADEEIAENLKINVNDSVYDILRLRFIDDKPCILERTYMSTSLIPGISMDVLKGSIYSYIENVLNYKIASAQKITRADVSKNYDHKYLELKDYEPVLEVEQIAYLDNGVPFEYSISRHRYDYFEFTTYSVRR